MTERRFECDICGYTFVPYWSSNEFYIKSQDYTAHICDDCLSMRKKKCSHCGSDTDLVFIHFPESSFLDCVSCKYCEDRVIDDINDTYDEVGDCVIEPYFPEFLHEDETFENNYPGVLDHQRQ